MKKLKRLIFFLTFSVATIAVTGLLAVWIVPLPQRLGTPGSRVVEYADSSPMCVQLSPDEKWRIPVSIEEVDPDYMAALLKFEDKRFYSHPGFDPIAITRAFFQNSSERRIVSGASTITMQLVRLLEPRPRTYRSKFVEVLRSVQLELHLSKREILESYLQFLPFGKNIEGIDAASLAYFGHHALDLSPFEIAYLLSVPQAPADRYPTPEHADEMPAVIAFIAHRLVDAGIFTKEQEAEAVRGSPISTLKPFPRDALHVSQYLIDSFEGMRVQSTVRRQAQSIAEKVIASYKDEFALLDINNAAVVVIDNKTSSVIAAVGNFDFWDSEHDGQVVGFLAPRSPGSAMKPFIYAMAVDRGLSLPGYLVADIPVKFEGYEPINYDRKFRGLVSLEESLSKSLNIPFVNLLDEIDLEEYLAFLRDSGISTLVNERGYYGLSIAIGALDVRPAELANMYAMLANNGLYNELKWTRDQEISPSKQLFNPGAAFLTRRTLRLRDRPDFPRRKSVSALTPGVFWKTGTSARHRDAWALGGTPGFTAGVWVGNFDGKPSKYLVGADRAGPILFDILEALSRGGASVEKDIPPADLVKVEVCAWSGRLAGPHCPETRRAVAMKTNMPTGNCPYHVEYWVDTETGYRLNPLCRAGRNAEPRVFTVLPASIRRWVADNRLQLPAPPKRDPSCMHVASGKGIQIISPKPNAVFFLIPGLRADQQEIPLEAEAGADVGELFWFVDGEFLASGPPHKRVWFEPRTGKHKLTVQDASGRSHTVHITILPPG